MSSLATVQHSPVFCPTSINLNYLYILDFGSLSGARKEWLESRDAERALKALGNRFCNERHLLLGLQKCGAKDYVGALSHVRHHLLLLNF